MGTEFAWGCKQQHARRVQGWVRMQLHACIHAPMRRLLTRCEAGVVDAHRHVSLALHRPTDNGGGFCEGGSAIQLRRAGAGRMSMWLAACHVDSWARACRSMLLHATTHRVLVATKAEFPLLCWQQGFRNEASFHEVLPYFKGLDWPKGVPVVLWHCCLGRYGRGCCSNRINAEARRPAGAAAPWAPVVRGAPLLTLPHCASSSPARASKTVAFNSHRHIRCYGERRSECSAHCCTVRGRD